GSLWTDRKAGAMSLARRQAGDIATRPRQIRDQTAAKRVRSHGKHDRDDRCHLLCSDDGGTRRDNDIDLESDKLGRDLGVALRASLRPPIDDGGGSAFNPTEFVQSLHKRRNIRSPGQRRGRPQEPDGRQLSRLLRVRRERPRRRAAEQCDELAAFHVWMAPAWQEIIWRAAQRSLAVMCPACWCSPGGLLALMGSANRVLIIRTGSMS